jgi:transposase
VAQNFLSCDREQELLLPPSLREWLPEGHLAWFLIDAVAQLDLAPFYAAYRDDGHGRAAHDPAMMVALLLYAYATGRRSSRVVERACVDDVAFRVVTANQRPDHCTIARFRRRHEAALAGLFGDVLAFCADAGLVGVAVLAVDGTKLHANASQHQNLDYDQIASEILADADAVDRAEDERFGERRGDELPPELATAQGRRGWLREAKRRLDERRAAEARPVPKSRPARLREGKRRLEEEHAVHCRANEAYEAYRARGDERRPPLRRAADALHAAGDAARQSQRQRPRLAQRQDAARLHAGLQRPSRVQREPDRGGRRDQRRLAGLWPPRADRLGRRARARRRRRRRSAGGGGGRRRLLAPRPDGRGRRPRDPGPDPARRRQTQRRQAGLGRRRYAFMRRVLETDLGKQLYGKRQVTIEPVLANTKFNRRLDRFLRRGRAACRSEWRLITATHNLLKLHTHLTAAAGA